MTPPPELAEIEFSAPPARRRAPVWLWPVYGVLVALLVAYAVSFALRPHVEYVQAVDGWMVDGFELVTSVLCIARAFVRRSGRSVALTLGLGLLSWCIGDILLSIESIGGATPPALSPKDLFYLGFYPLTYVAVVLFMRGQVRRLTPPSWLDGIVAGLGAAAVCAAFAFHSVLHWSRLGPAPAAANLAYPIGDLVLLALVVGSTALLPGRRKAPWLLLASACSVNAIGDTLNLFQSSFGSSRVGALLNTVAWPVAFVLMSLAVWLPERTSDALASERPTGFVMPGIAAISGLGILFAGSMRHVGAAALGLATATLLVAGVRLALSVRALRTLTEERHRQSVTDELTGLGNRRHLAQVLEALSGAGGGESGVRSLAFLFIDLNHFKEINDSFGHPAGDELLRQLGPRLSGSLRGSDVLVRLGGDEFAVVLADADAEYAKLVAHRISASLAPAFVLDVVSASISASIGIALMPVHASDYAGLLRCADVAMYRAKLRHVPFEIYDEHLDDDGNLLRLVEELRVAVEENHFELHYQPQLDLRDGRVSAVEALLRWPHPRLGFVPPLPFLPLAEEAGLMPSLTALVLDAALAQCARWREAGQVLAVSVNVSATNLLDDGFAGLIEGSLARHGLPAEALVLEITETCIISDYERSRRVIEELRNLGVMMSVDDFGAGFTSLAYLSDLAVGELKLDRTFITGLGIAERGRDLSLVRSTIELGHALGLRVVAEGIEDRATLELLTELGCDIAQGYFISKPRPAHELAFQTRAPGLPVTASSRAVS